MNTKSILFLCVANSARSQMAEALARHRFGDRVRAQSAGSRPSQVNPYALRALTELSVDTHGLHSKHVDTIDPATVELVITLCAEEECPVFLGSFRRLSWAMPDPDRKGEDLSDEARLQHFRDTRDAIDKRLADFEVDDDLTEAETVAAVRR
jgi:arsenate reductase (thioredoxin)